MLGKEVILVGYSGHAYVVADVVLDIEISIVGYSEKEQTSFNPYNLTYLGFENDTDFIGWSKICSIRKMFEFFFAKRKHLLFIV